MACALIRAKFFKKMHGKMNKWTWMQTEHFTKVPVYLSKFLQYYFEISTIYLF